MYRHAANGKSLPLAPAGTASNFAWSGKKTATPYRVTAPADPLLVHGNRLGGAKGPQPVPLQCDGAAMRAAGVKCRTAAVDGAYAMVAVYPLLGWPSIAPRKWTTAISPVPSLPSCKRTSAPSRSANARTMARPRPLPSGPPRHGMR